MSVSDHKICGVSRSDIRPWCRVVFGMLCAVATFWIEQYPLFRKSATAVQITKGCLGLLMEAGIVNLLLAETLDTSDWNSDARRSWGVFIIFIQVSDVTYDATVCFSRV